MAITLNSIRLLSLLLFLITGLQGTCKLAWAQEKFESDRGPQVSSIKIGPHPIYTRILINLTKPVSYKFKPDFSKKKITLTIQQKGKSSRLRSRSFKDKNLKQYSVLLRNDDLEITFLLKSANTRFFHSLNLQKSQIILDLKGENRPILRTRIGNLERNPKAQIYSDGQGKLGSSPKKARLAGYSPKRIQELVDKAIVDKQQHGWEEYQKALKKFQSTDYPEASKLFRDFSSQYPESKYLENVYYLKAEAEYRNNLKELNPIFDKALASYQLAMREFPKSKLYDHALLKVASIFNEIGYGLEARSLFNQGLKSDPSSLYNEVRENSLA